MRITTTLLAIFATMMLAAPVLARAHNCCCDECCDNTAAAASASVDADAVLKVLAQYGFYLGPYADMIEAGGGGIAIGAGSSDAIEAEGAALVAETTQAMPLPADSSPELHTFVFHCPVNFNSGEPIPAAQLDALEKRLCELAGGFTRSEAQGAWVYEGQLYHEPMRRYMLGLPESGIDELLDYAVDTLKQDFGQINVWVEIDGEPEIR